MPGAANLVILAFSREHQDDVENWQPHLAEVVEAHPSLEIWVVPALSRSYRFWHRAVESGMRAGLPDSHARRHTLITYLDLRYVQRALDMADRDDIHLYLLDPRGAVRWQGRGGYSQATLDALGDALREVLASS
ncbi:MAG: hypothetical protein A2W26_12695 [Acidobacteria bacterium RBG_16_64_8]|nr:MAG: hypothetical protein A2W26_12695 [Acidobacteria bacterium RBG_16_64_8]